MFQISVGQCLEDKKSEVFAMMLALETKFTIKDVKIYFAVMATLLLIPLGENRLTKWGSYFMGWLILANDGGSGGPSEEVLYQSSLKFL